MFAVFTNLLTHFHSFGSLVKQSDGTYELPMPLFSADATNAILWVKNALGASVLALFKNYRDRPDEIMNKTFVVANAHMTYPDFAAVLSKGSCRFTLLGRLADADSIRIYDL